MFGWSRKSRSTSGTGGARRYWWFCLINFWNFFSIHVCEVKKSIADIHIELPCLDDLENLGQLPVQKVLMIVSYEFLKFLHYLCFRGWGIHFWYSYWATMFRWPRKSRSTSGTGGTRRYWWFCLMNFQNFLVFMFPRSRNPLLIFLQSYHVWVTSKIQVNFRFRWYWWFCLMDFWNFSHYLGFQGQGIHCWYSYWATSFGWPRKSESTSGSRGFWGHPNEVAQ